MRMEEPASGNYMICAQQFYLDDQIEDEEKRELVIITGGREMHEISCWGK